jgi:hypothetical protein
MPIESTSKVIKFGTASHVSLGSSASVLYSDHMSALTPIATCPHVG